MLKLLVAVAVGPILYLAAHRVVLVVNFYQKR
jgi:hypothetical protein